MTPAIMEKSITLDSFDGAKIKLYVFNRQDAGNGPLPAILHFHGGTMVLADTCSGPHIRWNKSLAVRGVVSILVDFRNAFQPDGNHQHFPVGLSDTISTIKYVHAHKAALGISKIILHGDSGGANLSIAAAIKAKPEGCVNAIDGIYAYVPYISGACAWPETKRATDLPSHVENDGYVISVASTAALANFYTPNEKEKTDPLAWPYFATEQELKGLPPHFVTVNELDIFRDEGLALYRKLLRAGVRVMGDMNLGITHDASLMFASAIPDVHKKMVDQIAMFAKTV